MKKITLADLKFNDIIEIRKINNSNGSFMALVEVKSDSSGKRYSSIDIKPGTRLTFLNERDEFENLIFFNNKYEKLLIDESCLKISEFTLVTKK